MTLRRQEVPRSYGWDRSIPGRRGPRRRTVFLRLVSQRYGQVRQILVGNRGLDEREQPPLLQPHVLREQRPEFDERGQRDAVIFTKRVHAPANIHVIAQHGGDERMARISVLCVRG
jgi:hypothetical protein